jgi:hypothetical protein
LGHRTHGCLKQFVHLLGQMFRGLGGLVVQQAAEMNECFQALWPSEEVCALAPL